MYEPHLHVYLCLLWLFIIYYLLFIIYRVKTIIYIMRGNSRRGAGGVRGNSRERRNATAFVSSLEFKTYCITLYKSPVRRHMQIVNVVEPLFCPYRSCMQYGSNYPDREDEIS